MSKSRKETQRSITTRSAGGRGNGPPPPTTPRKRLASTAAPPTQKRGPDNQAGTAPKRVKKASSSTNGVTTGTGLGSLGVGVGENPRPVFEALPRACPRTNVIVFGQGDFGQLGLGQEVVEAPKPRKIALLDEKGVTTVSCGGLHNAALDYHGKVWTWGCNDAKALGRAGDETVPGKVDSLDEMQVAKVVCSDSATLALTFEGRVLMCGNFRDSEGVLGATENSKRRDTFLPVKFLFPKILFRDIAAGGDHFLGCTTAGDVFGWGNGEHSQLGRKIMARRKISGLVPMLVGLPSPFGGPPRLKGARISAVAVGAGAYHSMAVDEDGKLYAWGLNNYGQCGQIPETRCVRIPTKVPGLEHERVTKVAGGEHHTLILTASGHVYAMGRANMNQLGFDRSVPESQHDLLEEEEDDLPLASLDSEDQVMTTADSTEDVSRVGLNSRHCYGYDSVRQEFVCTWRPTRIPQLTDVTHITCGGHHNLAVTEDFRVFSWGLGELCQLGNRESKDIAVPTAVRTSEGVQVIGAGAGGHHSCLLIRKTAS